jgi:post-segregation antitoxin (ccd killing protein)
MRMTRTNYYFPRQMLERLRARSRATGLPVSELIRQAVAEFLAKSEAA